MDLVVVVPATLAFVLTGIAPALVDLIAAPPRAALWAPLFVLQWTGVGCILIDCAVGQWRPEDALGTIIGWLVGSVLALALNGFVGMRAR